MTIKVPFPDDKLDYIEIRHNDDGSAAVTMASVVLYANIYFHSEVDAAKWVDHTLSKVKEWKGTLVESKDFTGKVFRRYQLGMPETVVNLPKFLDNIHA